MFKIIALCGAIAGGATYGLYTQTDLFGGKCGGDGCPLAALKCCDDSKPSGDTPEPCCANGSAGTAPEACCLTKTSVKKAAPCCADPCPDCVKAASEACADCCGDSAKTAVAGPVGALAGSPRK